MTNLKLLGLALIGSIALVGCGSEEESTADSIPATGGNLGSGSVTEGTNENDTYSEAMTISFSNDKFTVRGTVNSSSDNYDYFKFVAPSEGKYVCGVKVVNDSSNDYELTVRSYHEGTSIVGGSTGSSYFDSGWTGDEADDDPFDDVTVVTAPTDSSLYKMEAGDTAYIRVYGYITGGYDATYDLECYEAGTYDNVLVTDTENENYPNYHVSMAQLFELNSSHGTFFNGKGNSSLDRFDRFKVTPTVTGSYDFTLQHLNTSDFDISIFTETEALSSSPDSMRYNTGSTSPSNITGVSLTADQTYYIRIIPDSTGGYTDDYNLTITKQ